MANVPNEGDEMLVHRGSTAPWTLYLYDLNGTPEDLALVDAATFVLAPKADSPSGDLVAQFSIVAGNLAVHTSTDFRSDPSWIRMTPSQVQADALSAGVFLGIGNLRFGAAGWMPSDPVRVRVRSSAAIKADP